MPNTFLSVVDNCGLMRAAIQSIDLSKKNMIMALMMIPPRMLIVSNSALRDIIVVNVPAPASNGKAIGTILPEELSPASDLNSSMPNIISIPIKNMTNEPARANDEISIPNKPSIEAPKNKKAIIILTAQIVTTDGLNSTPSFFILIRIGMFPNISITENKMTDTDSIAAMFISFSFSRLK